MRPGDHPGSRRDDQDDGDVDAAPAAPPAVGAVRELDVTALAAGGDGIAREATGRVVFVGGALPGEKVRARLTEERRDFARAELVSLVAPSASPSRVEPPCPFVAAGCGGCDWQHVQADAQRGLKGTIVADALRRIGGISEPVVDEGPALPATGYRTTLRGVSDGGRFALRRRHSHDLVAVDPCLIAHPRLGDVISHGRFPDHASVTLRCGARTGERLVVVGPRAAGTDVPEGVRVVGEDELRAGRRAWFHEEAAGRRWRISARAFFQSSAEGADALVDAARDASEGMAGSGTRVVDLFAGVGLFAGSLGAGASIEAVERSASAVADMRVNLAGLDVRIVRLDVDRWRPHPADLVVADPPRTGLGKRGVATVAATGAGRVVLVSCDPASLARDARLLAERGYALRRATLVDLFPHTSHVEVVRRFDRG